MITAIIEWLVLILCFGSSIYLMVFLYRRLLSSVKSGHCTKFTAIISYFFTTCLTPLLSWFIILYVANFINHNRSRWHHDHSGSIWNGDSALFIVYVLAFLALIVIIVNLVFTLKILMLNIYKSKASVNNET